MSNYILLRNEVVKLINSQNIKSPFNYIGNKHKLMPQLQPLFPKNINSFVDLFSGGLDVSINIDAENIFCNDINYHVIDIYREFQKKSIDEILDYIDSTIAEWGLSKENEKGFLAFRKYYNQTKNPLDLYVLMCYSFNYQFRFNSNHEYNNPFGKNRSSFNDNMRKNLIYFCKKISNFNFSSSNFKDIDLSFMSKNDFLYADPPYLISLGSYNDGKRGFEGWSEDDDIALFKLLDNIDSRGAKFALSNVIYHKGLSNDNLIKWMKKYNVHFLDKNYANCNYQKNNSSNITQEVLITNY